MDECKMYRLYRNGNRIWSCYCHCCATELLRMMSEVFPEDEFCIMYM